MDRIREFQGTEILVGILILGEPQTQQTQMNLDGGIHWTTEI